MHDESTYLSQSVLFYVTANDISDKKIKLSENYY